MCSAELTSRTDGVGFSYDRCQPDCLSRVIAPMRERKKIAMRLALAAGCRLEHDWQCAAVAIGRRRRRLAHGLLPRPANFSNRRRSGAQSMLQ